MLQTHYHQLSNLYDPHEAKAIVRMVFEQEFGISYTELLCNGENCLTVAQKQRLNEVISRLRQGEPVQYILGKAEFCGRMFKVTPATLIPRPETELLCTLANSKLNSQLSTLNSQLSTLNSQLILDIGTGSGCIAITLALSHPDWQIEAWDISEEALAVARENATTLGARNITFRKVDILNIHSSLFTLHSSLIISNPPYICNHERAEMDSRVLDYEPHQALFVPDDDPLLFYRAIADFAQKTLLPGGQLLFEVNSAHVTEVSTLLSHLPPFTNIQTLQDQYHNDRVVTASL